MDADAATLVLETCHLGTFFQDTPPLSHCSLLVQGNLFFFWGADRVRWEIISLLCMYRTLCKELSSFS